MWCNKLGAFATLISLVSFKTNPSLPLSTFKNAATASRSVGTIPRRRHRLVGFAACYRTRSSGGGNRSWPFLPLRANPHFQNWLLCRGRRGFSTLHSCAADHNALFWAIVRKQFCWQPSQKFSVPPKLFIKELLIMNTERMAWLNCLIENFQTWVPPTYNRTTWTGTPFVFLSLTRTLSQFDVLLISPLFFGI